MFKVDWTSLRKGDTLYLGIPYYDNNDNIIKYKNQESQVISIKEYKYIYRLVFKYTNFDGKRIRVNLAINKNKCSDLYLAVNRYTEYAKDYNIKYGDFIVTTINSESINVFVKDLICNKLEEEKIIVNEHQSYIEKLFELLLNKEDE
jgi:uncharacterized protein (DUF169 family)